MTKSESERISSLFRRSGAFLLGHFQLSSGLHSGQYLQCAKVLERPARAARLCRLLARHVAPWRVDAVAAPATGGILVGYELARALKVDSLFAERTGNAMSFRRGFEIVKGRRYLVAEDVVTTAGSAKEVARAIEAKGGKVAGLAALVFRGAFRSRWRLPASALLTLRIPVYRPERCPMCREGLPLSSPGSRRLKKKTLPRVRPPAALAGKNFHGQAYTTGAPFFSSR